MRSCAEPPRNTIWLAPSSLAARSTPDGSGRGWNARWARTTYSACASIGMPKQPCRNSCRKMSVPIRSRCSTSRTTRSRFSRRRIGTRRLPPANYAWTSFRFTAKYCSGHSLIAATVAETYNELLRCRRHFHPPCVQRESDKKRDRGRCECGTTFNHYEAIEIERGNSARCTVAEGLDLVRESEKEDLVEIVD